MRGDASLAGVPPSEIRMKKRGRPKAFIPIELATWIVPPKRDPLERILIQFGHRKELLDNTYLSGITLTEVSNIFEATK